MNLRSRSISVTLVIGVFSLCSIAAPLVFGDSLAGQTIYVVVGFGLLGLSYGQAAGAVAVVLPTSQTPASDAILNALRETARNISRELGATTVRFNFRGTGASDGLFDHGDGEADDLRAVVQWVREQRPGTQLWLAGFSFGAYVSLRASADLQPDALVCGQSGRLGRIGSALYLFHRRPVIRPLRPSR